MSESLENRRLLASVVLHVPGTDGDDVINVSTDGTTITIDVNDVVETFSDADITEINIDALAGNDTINLESNSDTVTSIDAGSGNDTINIAPTTGNLALIQGSLTVNGGDDDDALFAWDNNDNSGAMYDFTDTAITGAEFATINFSEIETADLQADKDINLIIVSNNSSLIQNVFGNEGKDVLYVSDTLTPVNIYGGPGLDTYQIDSDNFGPNAEAIVPANDDIEVVTVGTDSTLTIAANVTLTGDRENMAGRVNFGYRSTYIGLTGALPMLITEARIATTNGYNNGTWNGTHHAYASTYSAASPVGDGVGYARASDLGITEYNGIPLIGTDMIFTQTLYGDTDLNHTVNFPDLLSVAMNYGHTNMFWRQGDFDYDQTTGFNDLLRIAQNYNQSSNTSSKHRSGMTESILKED